jgi:PAS domain S-box-containing protein
VQSIGTAIDKQGRLFSNNEDGSLTAIDKPEGYFTGLYGHQFTIRYTDKDGNTHKVGKGVFYTGTKAVWQRVQYGFILIIFNAAIKTLVLWSVFFLSIRFILGRPLTRLAHQVEQLDPDDLKKIDIGAAKAGKNELAILGEAFNDLIDRLLESKTKLNNLNLSLQKHRSRLSEIVEERTLQLKAEIVERKNAEAAIKKSERRLKESQKIARLGQWDLDLRTNVLAWSDEIFRIFEVDPDKSKATYELFLETIHPQDRELVNQAYQESVKNKTPYDIVHRLLMKDGTVKFVHEICRTEYDKDGNPIRSIGTVQDITELKHVEEELASLNKLLELKVAERTNELSAANIGLQQEIIGRKKIEQGLKESEKLLRALSIRLQEVEETHRKAIARELHDRIGQRLTALNINLNIIYNQLRPEQREKLNDRIMDSIELVEKTTQNIRDVMADLRPQVLDDYGLAAALRWLCERFFQRSGIKVDLETDTVEEIRLPEMVETALFRITQEAFNNVIKHARAAHVSAAVVKGAEFIQLTINDNGQGFDPRAVRSSEKARSWGLVNMKERSEALGGQFQIESELKKGTRLRVEIPL